MRSETNAPTRMPVRQSSAKTALSRISRGVVAGIMSKRALRLGDAGRWPAGSCAGFGFVPARQVEVFGIRCPDLAAEAVLLRKPQRELAQRGHDGAGGGLAQWLAGRALGLLQVSAKAHRPFDMELLEILAPVPDVEPLQRREFAVQRLVGQLARILAVFHEATLQAFVLLVGSLGHIGLLSGAQKGQIGCRSAWREVEKHGGHVSTTIMFANAALF